MKRTRAMIASLLLLSWTATKAQDVAEVIEVKKSESAHRGDNTLYQSRGMWMITPKAKWDEALKDSVIEWPRTANEYRGDAKTVTAEELNFVGSHTESYQKIFGHIKGAGGRNDLSGLFWELKEEENQTVLHCYFPMRNHPVKRMWLGGEETYIVDEETGVHYKARGSQPDVMRNHFVIKAPKDSLIDFTITFPPLPGSTRHIAITGVPNWGLYDSGQKVKLQRKKAGESVYDTIPRLRTPRQMSPEQNYDKNNARTWAYYHEVHTIRPLENEETFALWRTPKTTYLAIPRNQTWRREFYGFDDTTFLLDGNGNRYKIKGIQGIPLNHVFWIKECAGDWFAFVLEFEPIPLDVTHISYIELDGEPFNAYGANWKGKQILNLEVETLRENQKLFEYVERKIIE